MKNMPHPPSRMWPVYVLAILCSLIITATTYAEDEVSLICSCGKPALVIQDNKVFAYDASTEDPHILQIVEMACKQRTHLPGAKVYYIRDAIDQVCPVDM